MSKITITACPNKIETVVMFRKRLNLGLKESKDYAEGKTLEIGEENLLAPSLYLDLLGTGATVSIEPLIPNWHLESLIHMGQDEILLQARRIDLAKRLLADPTRKWEIR